MKNEIIKIKAEINTIKEKSYRENQWNQKPVLSKDQYTSSQSNPEEKKNFK